MNLLLDTHIFLWSLLEPERLGEKVAAALEATENSLWLSPITSWEVLVLAEKGRVELRTNPRAWMRHALAELPFRVAPINHQVAIESRRVRLPHQDPADRFLAATAIVHDLVLVTADERLIRAREIPTLAHR